MRRLGTTDVFGMVTPRSGRLGLEFHAGGQHFMDAPQQSAGNGEPRDPGAAAMEGALIGGPEPRDLSGPQARLNQAMSQAVVGPAAADPAAAAGGIRLPHSGRQAGEGDALISRPEPLNRTDPRDDGDGANWSQSGAERCRASTPEKPGFFEKPGF
jgi:hypothetical protein